MKKKILHNKPTIDKEEIQAVTQVLKSGWLVQGPKTQEFENTFCNYIGLPEGRAVAMSNGTSALYVALKALKVGEGDEVIVPTYVCTSLLNAVYMAQAKPIIADIQEKDFNMSLLGVKKKATNKTKAVILPHMFGVPADIVAMRQALRIPIIEDCATAIGSRIGQKHVGTFTNIAIFSFYASKMVATGQGGMVVSNNPDYVEKARDFIDFDLGKGKQRGTRPFYPRFNLEITDIQSALGIAQLKKIAMFLESRKKIASAYQNICNAKGWDYQKPVKDNFQSNNYRFVIKADEKTIGKLQEHLKKNDIDSMIPIEHWELLHNFLKLKRNNFKIAEMISKQTLSLPIYPDLIKENNIGGIIECLKEF